MISLLNPYTYICVIQLPQTSNSIMSNIILLEDGLDLLLEDGTNFLLEG